jgi:ABC-type dipeptide/oligopeptide/nickel transport system ATPase component
LSPLEVRDPYVWSDLPQGPPVHAAAGVSFADGRRPSAWCGESGCGSITTVLALMGLLPPTPAGIYEVLVDGRNTRPGARTRCAGIAGRTSRWLGRDERDEPGEEDRLVDRLSDGVFGVAKGPRHAPGLLELSGSPPRRRNYPHKFPVACGSARPSRWPSPASRRSCSPTSRPPR